MTDKKLQKRIDELEAKVRDLEARQGCHCYHYQFHACPPCTRPHYPQYTPYWSIVPWTQPYILCGNSSVDATTGNVTTGNSVTIQGQRNIFNTQ